MRKTDFITIMITLAIGASTILGNIPANGVYPANEATVALENFLDPSPLASESASAAIRRTRDGRVITAPNAAFPNDRVKRGENYALEIGYTTDAVTEAGVSQTPGPNFHAIKVVMKVSGRVAETRYYHNLTRRSVTFKWAGTVSTDVNADNVTFEVYNNRGGLMARTRLPIGTY